MAVVAAAVMLLAGCSGTAGDKQPRKPTERPAVRPPTGAGYSESLRELCGRTMAAHDAVGIATSPDELVRKLPRTTAIDRRFLAELKRLVAPAGLAADASRLVALFGRVNANEDLALEHLRLKNFNGYFQFMDSALVVRLETDRIALRLAAPGCTFRPFRGR